MNVTYSRQALRHLERHFVCVLRVKKQLTSPQLVKRIHDVNDDVMRDAK